MSSSDSAVFDLIERIAASATINCIWKAYFNMARGMGISFGLACFLPGPDKLSDVTFADSMPTGWVRDYTEQNLVVADRLCHRLLRSHSPFEWSLPDFPRPETGAPWHEFLLAHDMQSGFAVPDYSQGDLSVISLTGTGKPLHRRDRSLLHFAGLALLARCRDLGVRRDQPAPPLSDRERECLQWAAAGKSDWEIGEIIGLSEKTVNIYVERAKHKLGVATRTQAIVRAIRAGIINP